jgi:hypothetical protein
MIELVGASSLTKQNDERKTNAKLGIQQSNNHW